MRNCLFLIFLFCITPVYSQTKTINNNIWISAGRGFYKSGRYTGFSRYASLNWSRFKNADTINSTKKGFLPGIQAY
jgi:hypothetical protein